MKSPYHFLFSALAAFLVGATGVSATPPTLPLKVAERDWRELSQRRDPRLQDRLDKALKQRPLWQALIKEEKMAVGLIDLRDNNNPRFAEVNGNTMMYAASIPKIAVLLAAFQGFEDGTLKETPAVNAEMVEMIRRSDNVAATKLIHQIGLRKIERVILDPRYRFYDHKNGGIWVGSAYGGHLEQNPDPLKNLEHAATVYQVCRFYYFLTYGRLVNAKSSRQMLKIMAFPDLDDKFVHALGKAVPLNQVHRKSGEWKSWYSDSMLVWAEGWRRYVLVALIDNPQGETILRELVPVAEQILKTAKTFRTIPSK